VNSTKSRYASRRRFLRWTGQGALTLACAGAGAGASASAGDAGNGPAPTDQQEWEAFKQRYVVPEGRVIDTGNNRISHSEGQGWGLLFAATFDDRPSFDRMLDWTSRALRRPQDSLHAWRFDPAARDPVGDRNNATDGDLFIAAALTRSARAWHRPDHLRVAAVMAQDILDLLVQRSGERTILLPGAAGFTSATGVVINPSYYAFPALDDIAPLVPSEKWDALRRDGLALINEGRFGRWMLPPDWLLIAKPNGSLAPAPAWPARYSYDAVRVPLYLAWSRLFSPGLQQAFTAFWSSNASPFLPAWVDLQTDAVSPYRASAGMMAVSQVAATSAAVSGLPADFPTVASAADYYSAALILLSRIAWNERRSG
jgi:endoglucanase